MFSMVYVIMREEYSKLGKSLFLYYTTRLLGLAFLFYSFFACVNQAYTRYYDIFPNCDQNIPFDRLANVIQIASDAAKSMLEVSEFTLNENYAVNNDKYCTADQSLNECRTFLLKSPENQLAFNAYGLYTSFECLQGDCSQLSDLWDYYWTFRIRLPFIDYAIVEYNSNGNKETLIAPACSTQRVTFNFSNSEEKWVLNYTSGVFALSYRKSDDLRVTVVMDSQQLANKYSIYAENYDIPAQQSSPSNLYLIFSLQNTPLFGFSSKYTTFTTQRWLFSVLTLTACILCLSPMLCLTANVIQSWQQGMFKQMQSLDNLYQYQINSIFQGQKPKKSIVLNDSSFTHFYEDLAEVVDKDCQPLLSATAAAQKEQTFKFTALIDRVMAKFQESLKPLEQQRARQFSNLKPLIRSSISQISQSVQRKLKALFVKARELGMAAQFFHFGYLALLQATSTYEQLLTLQKTALPDALVVLFRYMNHTIHSADLKFAFKFAFAYNNIIEQQIIMRLQDQLLPKYLDALKNLDVVEPTFRHRLKLAKRLADLELAIENKRHISAVYLK